MRLRELFRFSPNILRKSKLITLTAHNIDCIESNTSYVLSHGVQSSELPPKTENSLHFFFLVNKFKDRLRIKNSNLIFLFGVLATRLVVLE